MSGQEMPRGAHKENPAESSLPPKRSTIRNIFRSFPTPSIRTVRGYQQAHGVRRCGGGTGTSGNEAGISIEGMQNVGLSDDKHESNSKMSNQEEVGEEEGGEGVSAAASQHNLDSNSELPNQGGEVGGEERRGGGEGGDATASQHNFDSNSELPSQGEEGGEKEGGGGGAASQHNFENEEKNELTTAASKDDKKPDENLETNNTEDRVGKPDAHTFSFCLIDPQKEEPQPDLSSESQPQTTSTTSLQQTHPAANKSRTKTKKQKGLNSTKDSKDSDSSVSSRKRSSKSKTKIKSKFAPGSLEYIEERLCGRIFSGWVEERQWVECVGGYRDVIEVDEWEVEMNQQLQAIISSIPGVQDRTRWINITPPDKNPYYCLWVLLEAPPTPGHYWYTVTGTKLQPQFGLMISVKEIRSIHPHDGELAAARRQRLKKKFQGAPQNELESLSEVLRDWVDQFTSLRPATVLSAITSTLTFSNIKETIRFLTVLLMTIVIGLLTFVRESHVVGLRFVREAGIFFHNATPFLQTLLGFFEKIVGGLYLLVAMVYRDLRRPSVPPPRFPPPPPPSLTPSPPRPSTGPRAIQYVSPERWVVRTQNNEFT